MTDFYLRYIAQWPFVLAVALPLFAAAGYSGWWMGTYFSRKRSLDNE